jgi:hypothetical protein
VGGYLHNPDGPDSLRFLLVAGVDCRELDRGLPSNLHYGIGHAILGRYRQAKEDS